MKFLSPILNLIKRFGFIYRAIGLVACFFFFSENGKNLLFLSTTKGSEPITIDQLRSLPENEIPRYLKLKDVALLSDSYAAEVNEDSEKIINAYYPVYSLDQIGEDASSLNDLTAHVIVKDKDFSEESMAFMTDIDGKYEQESFGEIKGILTDSGVFVSDKAVLIVKEKPPVFSSALLWTLLSGLAGLLILASFIPQKYTDPNYEAKLEAARQEEMRAVHEEMQARGEGNVEGEIDAKRQEEIERLLKEQQNKGEA